MILLVLLLVFVAINAAMWLVGADSRDGRDWSSPAAKTHVSTHGRG
jgi:hypothetical protein